MSTPPDLNVQTIAYPHITQPAPLESCDDHEVSNEVEVWKPDRALPHGCEWFGDIFIGDSGSSYECEPKQLFHMLRHSACKLGTMKTQLIHITEPGDMSSCYQLRAALVVCEEDSE